ncbi:uncharacterized protein HRG_04814 [Hirsutella rhossiliensis]|uniref:Uncharacterized protein n=1 Tax=Hirsutella rhossiliensis TaxID=111463 RepID=A0A9P8SKR0_9HYPO|nr:uncharacterized protein HRG_04814 [Hirsutella rhossiliensis]KAH0964386.1 hypothetical protein HRG_04814 [Hirsutella rhossiliensis]
MLASGLPLAVLSTLVFAPTLHAAAKCYGVDGTPSDDSQRPCNPDAEFSPCCATNKDKADICMSSGLCYAQDAGYEGFIYSNGCTDPTGRAEACPHFCPDQTNDWKGGPAVSSYNVLQCNEGGRYCCRKALEPENCCGNKSAVMTINVGQLRLATRTRTRTRTGDAGATTTVTSTSCDLAQSSGSLNRQCPKDNSAIVGGAVGGVLGAALLASLAALAVMCLRRPKEHYTHNGPMEYSNIAVSGGHPHELSARPVHEMQGSQVRSDVDSSLGSQKPY